jgi:hypothetical protein
MKGGVEEPGQEWHGVVLLRVTASLLRDLVCAAAHLEHHLVVLEPGHELEHVDAVQAQVKHQVVDRHDARLLLPRRRQLGGRQLVLVLRRLGAPQAGLQGARYAQHELQVLRVCWVQQGPKALVVGADLALQ